MREINFKVYSYDELSDEAKRVAIEKSRQSVEMSAPSMTPTITEQHSKR